MANAPLTLPSAASLRAPLRKITETLAAEINHPTELPPQWSDLEWRLARAVAAMHGVSPLLAYVLQWREPADFRHFLAAQRDQTAQRHGAIAQLLARIEAQARAMKVAVQPLKGAALHALGIYTPGQRPMADVDLLVRETDISVATRLLEMLGYEQTGVTWKHRAFEPRSRHGVVGAGEHAGNPINIDLHHRIVELLPRRATDITATVAPSSPHTGINAYPSRTALMLHLLLHTSGDMANHGVRLISLHDIARVADGMTGDEWGEIIARGINERGLPWALPPLRLTARYFHDAVPSEAIAQLERGCSWRLLRASRRLMISDVSYSNPFVSALPGAAWAPSMMELMGYVIGRIVDGRKAEFDHVVQSEGWAKDSRWFRASQARRLLIWATSRPPRVQTMYSVREAFRQTA
jgi:Uncharacterised nucleotidyltransferase